MKTGRFSIASIYINCPTPRCGGGIEGTDGSFMLDSINKPDIRVGDAYDCWECKKPFKVPASFRKI